MFFSFFDQFEISLVLKFIFIINPFCYKLIIFAGFTVFFHIFDTTKMSVSLNSFHIFLKSYYNPIIIINKIFFLYIIISLYFILIYNIFEITNPLWLCLIGLGFVAFMDGLPTQSGLLVIVRSIANLSLNLIGQNSNHPELLLVQCEKFLTNAIWYAKINNINLEDLHPSEYHSFFLNVSQYMCKNLGECNGLCKILGIGNVSKDPYFFDISPIHNNRTITWLKEGVENKNVHPQIIASYNHFTQYSAFPKNFKKFEKPIAEINVEPLYDFWEKVVKTLNKSDY